MKNQLKLTFAVATLVAHTAMAADMAGMKMDSPSSAASEQGQVNHAVGVVKAVDATKGAITLSHEAVPEIKWPAMTMAFSATPAQMASVKVGQKVQFEFTAVGMKAAITKIEPAE